MKITRTSTISGKTRTRDIDVTEEQLSRWKAGGLIQVVMPHLSSDDREFLMSGITPEEWDELFKDPDFDPMGDKMGRNV